MPFSFAMPSRPLARRARVLSAAVALLLVALSIAVSKPAHAAAPKALVLGDSITTGFYSSGLSDEEIQAQSLGFTVTRVSGSTWQSMTASQFAQYQVLIIGDRTCSGTSSYQAAINNRSVWQPVVMASGGNKVVIGTDPVYHYHYSRKLGALTLINHGISYAGAQTGATGIYWDLTCEAPFGGPSNVYYLDGLTTKGPGHWYQGVPPCFGSISIVAQSGPTEGLHDSDLSNWSCSVHEYFTSWPSDFTVLAMATDRSVPHTYAATDVDTGASVSGSPYILVSGTGIKIVSNITLTPATGSDPAGGVHTVTATVLKNGNPEAGKVVNFSVDAGPNTGTTGSGTTNSAGQTTFTYTSNGVVGTDTIAATFTDDAGLQEKGTASETWTSAIVATTTTYTGAANGDYTDSVKLSATLTSTATGAGIPGKSLDFTLGSQSCSAGPTDAGGAAACNITLSQAPGTYSVTASFAGDAGDTASSATASFTITREDTAVTVTGPAGGEYNDGVTFSARLTDPSGGAPLAGQTLSFTLGSQSCSGVTGADGTAGCSLVLSQTPGSYTLSVSFAGTTYYLPSSADAPFTLNREDDRASYTGATSGDYHDAVTLSGGLVDAEDGTPVAGKTLTLSIGSQSCSSTTDASGNAACSLVLNQPAGSYSATAAFAGDAYYVPGSAGAAFTVNHEETTLSYTGDTVIANGSTAHMSGTLLEDGTTAIAGRTVTFTLGSGATAQSCTGTTDAGGRAACDIQNVNQPLGPGTVTDSFAGDAYYLPSSSGAATLGFAFASGGSFVVGDRTPAATGSSVDFWGAQWAKDNNLSGGSAPKAFKGFEDSTALPTCGVNWTTDPGNSSAPPAGLPAYMGVLVSSRVGKAGSAISGDTVHIVVVTPNGGYANDPGHEGTGTVVAQYC